MSDTSSSNALLIDGQWCAAADGRTYDVINPATEDPISSVAYGGRAETRRALAAAANCDASLVPAQCLGPGRGPQKRRRLDARALRCDRQDADA